MTKVSHQLMRLELISYMKHQNFIIRLENNIKSIFLDRKLQERFGYTDTDFTVDIGDDGDYRESVK